MTPSSEAENHTAELVLETTRVFDAPRALLFRIWAEPEHRVRWWGPEGFALSHCEVDFHEGGAWSVAMRNVEGHEHWVRGTFTEIREPSRICFTYINDYDPFETLVTIDFIDLGARTEMRFRQAPFPSVEERDGHSWGWNSSMELLADYVRRVSRIDPQPVGRPRIDGVAADIIAARERHQFEMRKDKTEGGTGNENED